MYLRPDPAWKFGCGRYIQRPDAFMDLKKEIGRIGSKALILSGRKAWQAVLDIYDAPLEGIDCCHRIHTQPCSEEAARRYARDLRQEGADVIVGIGGGRIMDLAKLTGEFAGCPVINVPTICATCAAYTPLSVLYTPEGRALGSWFFENEIACLIADTRIMARQPARYAFAGIADSMAKMIELDHNMGDAPAGADMVFARYNAEYLYRRLSAIAPGMPAELANGIPSPLIDEMVYLTVAATGMVSGCARGRGQSALAHGLYEAARTLFTREAAGYLHGEIVGVGLRLQLEYDGRDLKDLDRILASLGLPMHLRDISIPEDGAVYDAIAEDLEKRDLLSREGDSVQRAAQALRRIG